MKGQEVFSSYQMQFHDKIINTRQSFLLDHYKFQCRSDTGCQHLIKSNIVVDQMWCLWDEVAHVWVHDKVSCQAWSHCQGSASHQEDVLNNIQTIWCRPAGGILWKVRTITQTQLLHTATVYFRVHGMWSNYYKELNNTLEKPNKGYVRLASRLRDVLWLRWGNRGKNITAPLFANHRTVA